MSITIIYLHGFNSDKNGKTAVKLKEIFGENFHAINYDYINPDKAFEGLEKQIKEITKPPNDDFIMVGTSLGGFWANYFAQKHMCKCVLNNPAIKPSETMKKYIGENENHTTKEVVTLTEADCEKYKKYEVPPVTPHSFKVVVIG